MGPAARPPLTAARRAGEVVVVVLVALGDADLHGDQNAYDLLVARKLSPSLLARDALCGYDPDRRTCRGSSTSRLRSRAGWAATSTGRWSGSAG
ncbi:MAG TPA: hypothetical protein VFL90_18675 [Methylomirabilota bacterium]|nr:hypothetical protein [Methylomirabilota bacterium]